MVNVRSKRKGTVASARRAGPGWRTFAPAERPRPRGREDPEDRDQLEGDAVEDERDRVDEQDHQERDDHVELERREAAVPIGGPARQPQVGQQVVAQVRPRPPCAPMSPPVGVVSAKISSGWSWANVSTVATVMTAPVIQPSTEIRGGRAPRRRAGELTSGAQECARRSSWQHGSRTRCHGGTCAACVAGERRSVGAGDRQACEDARQVYRFAVGVPRAAVARGAGGAWWPLSSG